MSGHVLHCVAMRSLFPNKRRRALEKERVRLHEEMEVVVKKATVVFHPQTQRHTQSLFRDLEKWSVWRELRDVSEALERVHDDLSEWE